MHASAVHRHRIAPSAAAASSVVALLVDDCARDLPRVALPRAEAHLVVRFGPSVPGGVDMAAMGGRQRVHRKLIRGGQRTVMARLRLGAHEAVLGVRAAEIAGRIVMLDALWGDAATRRLTDRLADARSDVDAAAALDQAIADRVALVGRRRDPSHVVIEAAERLASANVSAVAIQLGVSERSLRRVFGEAVGMSPKAFAKLARFHRALRATSDHSSWARIAAGAGYYDQAHLIADFRAIAGVTPRALLSEMRASASNEPPAVL